jgi:electron transfer flavoprotein beta subunit
LEWAYVLNRDVNCEILSGSDGSELAAELTDKLLALKIL